PLRSSVLVPPHLPLHPLPPRRPSDLDLFDIYSRHQREIDDALSAYGQRRAYRAAAKLRAGTFSTHLVFVHGDAGIGKTRFASDLDRKSTRLNSSHVSMSYAVFCLKTN